jgi:hypothetical protein
MLGKTSYVLNIIGISCQAIFWIQTFGLTLPSLNNILLFLMVIGANNIYWSINRVIPPADKSINRNLSIQV